MEGKRGGASLFYLTQQANAWTRVCVFSRRKLVPLSRKVEKREKRKEVSQDNQLHTYTYTHTQTHTV